MTLRTLNYGNYGIFLIMGNAGFCPSAVFGYVDPFGEVGLQGLSGAGTLGLRASRLGLLSFQFRDVKL